MPAQRLLVASILLVLCGAAAASPMGRPDASSGIPDINGGTVTRIQPPGAPPGTVLAPAATRPRAGVDVLVDRPSALGAGDATPPSAVSAGQDPFAGLSSRPSALASAPPAPKPPVTVTPVAAPAVPRAVPARPRAYVEVFALSAAPRAPHRLPGPITHVIASPRHSREPTPVITTVLPDLTVFASRLPLRSDNALPAIPLVASDIHSPRVSISAPFSQPPVAVQVIASVLARPLELSPAAEPLPEVRVALPSPAVSVNAPAFAVADLTLDAVGAIARPALQLQSPSVAPMGANPLIAIRTSAALVQTSGSLPGTSPETRVMAAANRAGLRPTLAPAPSPGDSSSSVDDVLAQVAVLERQVAIQQAQNDQRAMELAAQKAHLREERSRLAEATQVAMEQYVDTSPLPH
mgnify:CR=1 FL=1